MASFSWGPHAQGFSEIWGDPISSWLRVPGIPLHPMRFFPRAQRTSADLPFRKSLSRQDRKTVKGQRVTHSGFVGHAGSVTMALLPPQHQSSPQTAADQGFVPVARHSPALRSAGPCATCLSWSLILSEKDPVCTQVRTAGHCHPAALPPFLGSPPGPSPSPGGFLLWIGTKGEVLACLVPS